MLRTIFKRIGFIDADIVGLNRSAFKGGAAAGISFALESIRAVATRAENDLQEAINRVPSDEREQWKMIWSGEMSAPLNFIEHVPIEGSHQQQIIFSGKYTEILQHLNLRSVAVEDSKSLEPRRTTKCTLTHWQVKRAWISHLAETSLKIASNSIESGDLGGAAHFLSDALKLIGAISVPSPDDIEQSARTETAKKGGETTAAKLEPLKQEAFRLVRQKVDAEKKKWPSQSQAARAIRQDIQNFATKNDLKKLSDDEMQARKTIAAWLGTMEDRDTLFASKKSASASKSSTPAS